MMRYTENRYGRIVIPKRFHEAAIEKLARYENSGLDPEQIYEIDRLYAEKCAELARIKAEHGRQKAEIMIYLDWLDGQLIDDPVSLIRQKIEEILK